jgi:SAM-dependent methyltransferase
VSIRRGKRSGMWDGREAVAKYYDLAPHHPDDIPFYIARVLRQDARVLELGCGTGRVSIPLAQHCALLHGIDHSESMLAACRGKVQRAGIKPDRAQFSHGDISDFDLGEKFDLIIAPFRVIQNLETDDQLQGLFECVRRHLSPSGRCVLNVFRPSRDRDGMKAEWASPDEQLAWEVEMGDGRLACYDHRVRVTDNPLVLHPRLIYRRFVGEVVVDEAVLEITMRCFYPEEFLRRIRAAGFAVTDSWGGYAGERYGDGTELVAEFTLDT